jgi:hypothetical protein
MRAMSESTEPVVGEATEQPRPFPDDGSDPRYDDTDPDAADTFSPVGGGAPVSSVREVPPGGQPSTDPSAA